MLQVVQPDEVIQDGAKSQEDSGPAPPEPPKEAPSASAQVKAGSEATTHEFQAETKKLLDIVAKSLYSEKEVFIRSGGLERLPQTEIVDTFIPYNSLFSAALGINRLFL